jgi:hypothetical protein
MTAESRAHKFRCQAITPTAFTAVNIIRSSTGFCCLIILTVCQQNITHVFTQNAFHIFPLVQWVMGTLYPHVNWQGHEADQSPPSNAGVKNVWSYTSIPSHAFMALQGQCYLFKIHALSGAAYQYIIPACTFDTVFHIYVLCYNLLTNSNKQ